MFGDDFPWIKFSIICIPLIIIMLIWSPGVKWKAVNITGVLIGAYFAVQGKTLNFHGRR